MAVVRVARHRAHAHDQAFLGGHRHRHLHAELVRRPGLALGDAFHFRGMQRVQLVLRVALLRMQTPRDVDLLLQRARDHAALALHVADHAAQPRAKFADLAMHAPVLLGVRVAASLKVGGLADSRVALAQRDAGLLRGIDELLASAVEESAGASERSQHQPKR